MAPNPTGKKPEDLVLTPGGLKPPESVHAVAPGEVVRQHEGGALVVEAAAAPPQPAAGPPVADDFVLTPGGYRHRSLVHTVEPDHKVDALFGVLTKRHVSGQVIQSFGPAIVRRSAEPLMPLNVGHRPRELTKVQANHLAPALGSGWIVFGSWTNDTGHPITLFRTTWTVPPNPATEDSQTIFLFNGIQNSSMIYQPVLQFGSSAAGGGNKWSVASWYADGQGGTSFHSSLVDVHVGDRLVGVMRMTSQKATLGDTSTVTPSIASLNGRLYIAWSGVGNLRLNVMDSTDNGRTFGNKFTSGETSPQGPSICAHNGHLYIAWKGNGNNNLNVAQVVLSGNQITGFTNKVTLGETSTVTPVLASFNGRLYLAWSGVGNDDLNVAYSTDDGHSFGHKFTSGERSPMAPTLAVFNGSLFIGWKGDGNNNLNVARVNIVGNAINALANKVILGDTSPAAPSLASIGNRLYLAWRGNGNTLLNVMSSPDGQNFGNKFTSEETSPQGPTLTVHNSNLYIAWKGDGNNNLNVATVTRDGATIPAFFGSGDLCSYQCEFEGIANTQLPVKNIEQLTWAVETLEAYQVAQALDYPATMDTSMAAIEIKTGTTEAPVRWTVTNSVTDTGQHAVAVSNATPGGDVDLFYFRGGITQKAILGDTSQASPAIASLNGRLYIAWSGVGNHQLNVMESSDNGRTFTNKFTSGETSPEGPALCAHDGNLYIAWKGNGNNNLNVAQVTLNGAAITGFAHKVTLGETSTVAPALASFNGRLYLAWAGVGNLDLNVNFSSDNGHTFGGKFTSGETSPQAPALGVVNGELFIGWKGNGNDNLNVARVAFAGNAISGLVNKAILGDSSPVGPALAGLNTKLYLGWKGDGNDWLNVEDSADGHSFAHKFTSWERSPKAPALAAHAGKLYIAWKGDGNDNLNVAQANT